MRIIILVLLSLLFASYPMLSVKQNNLLAPETVIIGHESNGSEENENKIELLGLKKRILNALKRGRVFTIDELIQKSEKELSGFEGISKVALADIKEALARRGLSLSPEAPNKNNTEVVKEDEAPRAEISRIGLTPRTVNTLIIFDITTLDQLTEKSPEYLLELRGFGKGTLVEVERILGGLGLRLSVGMPEQRIEQSL